eukprot:gnl/MRDRNA2_/MRDRNA2_115662_c0_seq1.p1 gnl/MRDRNA2_/MRDRNA2_115662_c0~~gnl/MRDRNA2_/MRDRNA2_115662_c0_seq1.p1  ORF type:complete len:455 (-),score=78.04 gnl/MRDRNA2_/MRDRNA2_115662_c0_seq1:32-1318(-)
MAASPCVSRSERHDRENRAPQLDASDQVSKRPRLGEPQTPQADKGAHNIMNHTPAQNSMGPAKQTVLERQAETRDFSGPKEFLAAPKGERLIFSEEGVRVTRESGVGHGTCFLGPFSTTPAQGSGSLSFEVEILELESKSQTMAIGVVATLPPENQAHLLERARDLGEGSIIIGYDLPKLFIHGKESAKVSTAQWRPLKELALGDRIALRVDRGSAQLTILVNGQQRVQLEVPALADKQRFPAELWGVVDVYGAVKSVRLVTPGVESLAIPAATTAGTVAAPLRQREPSRSKEEAPTKEVTDNPRSAKKRRSQHPCGCFVHLVDSSDQVIHVPVNGLVIGRDPRAAGLVLDSEEVPNMVSRRHCQVLGSSGDEKVEFIDFGSMNGTWVNGAKMMRGLLNQGDEIVVGNPARSPKHFQFKVSLPIPVDA